MKIGVLADTHIPTKAKELPGRVIEGFKDVDLIIHAGDIVNRETLERLQEIAPLKAVAGNVDSHQLKKQLGLNLTWRVIKLGLPMAITLRGISWINSAISSPKRTLLSSVIPIDPVTRG